MESDKVTILSEVFKNDATNENVVGITVIIDGKFNKGLDIILKNKNYSSYVDLLKDAIFKGLYEISK